MLTSCHSGINTAHDYALHNDTSSLYNIIVHVDQQTLDIVYKPVSPCMYLIILESSLLYSNCLRCNGGVRETYTRW